MFQYHRQIYMTVMSAIMSGCESGLASLCDFYGLSCCDAESLTASLAANAPSLSR